MKSYFLSFEFFGSGYAKYISSVIEMDLDSDCMIDKARQLIAKKLGDGYGDANIKVLAFNNIE